MFYHIKITKKDDVYRSIWIEHPEITATANSEIASLDALYCNMRQHLRKCIRRWEPIPPFQMEANQYTRRQARTHRFVEMPFATRIRLGIYHNLVSIRGITRKEVDEKIDEWAKNNYQRRVYRQELFNIDADLRLSTLVAIVYAFSLKMHLRIA